MPNPIVAWLHAAAMALPNSAFLIVSHIAAVGTLLVRRNGTAVITACLSYRTLQQRCALSPSSVSSGIQAAVRTGWLVRPPRIAPGVPAIYAVPVPDDCIEALAAATKTIAPQPSPTNDGAATTTETVAPSTNDRQKKYSGAPKSVAPPPPSPGHARPDGVADIISFLRDLLLRVTAEHPEQVDLQLRIARALCRAAVAQHALTENGRNESVTQAIQNVFDHIFKPLGIDPAQFIVPLLTPDEKPRDPPASAAGVPGEAG